MFVILLNAQCLIDKALEIQLMLLLDAAAANDEDDVGDEDELSYAKYYIRFE